jgi:N-acetyl-alpha-D-muramate 1-phosphate uridylyltransferase
MVLAAGYGKRMRNLTEGKPKPLVEFMRRPLIDHVLERLTAVGVSRVVVNVHHFADLLQGHLKGRTSPQILISDEREQLLETGGGIRKALPFLGDKPFLLVNCDSLWIEGEEPNLSRLVSHFDPLAMDGLLMLAPLDGTLGYDGRGDYFPAQATRIRRRGAEEKAPYVYAGAAILTQALFRDSPEGAFPLGPLFDRAEKNARLHGMPMLGTYLHVGSPEAVAAAEEAVARAKR